MATVKQLKEILEDYPDDMELLCPNGSHGRATRYDLATIVEVSVESLWSGGYESSSAPEAEKALSIDLVLPF